MIQGPARQKNPALPFSRLKFEGDGKSTGLVLQNQRSILIQFFPDIRQAKKISLNQSGFMVRVHELQRQHPEIDKVRFVDSGKADSDHRPQPQMPWGKGCLLPAGALSVIVPGHYHERSGIPGFFRKIWRQSGEYMIRHRRDV